MAGDLSCKSLLEKALHIEQQGTAFYDTIARSANSLEAANLLKKMVDKCHRHINILQTLYDKTSRDDSSEIMSGNDSAYLLSLIEELRLNEKLIIEKITDGIKSDAEALELAAITKKNILLFYGKLLNTLPKDAEGAIRQILTEDELCFSEIKTLEYRL